LTERSVVLFDELAERLRHLVRAREHDCAGIRVELPTQAEFEAFEAVGDERLQTGQFLDVLVDPVVLQLSQGIDDFIQLARVDVLAAQNATKAPPRS
jgi:hypothetical protein